MPKSVINAFQKILNIVKPPTIEGDFPTQFALKRFVKKFEIPDNNGAEQRKLKTFEAWRDYDSGLKDVILPHSSWYTARLLIHKIMRDFHHGELALTGGSQSEPLRGMQSIADKLLTHKWEVSPGCADLFVNLAIDDKAFMKAAKIRLRRSLGDKDYRQEVKRIYRLRRRPDDVKRFILYSSLVERDHSRYSTVRKNNEIDRSIDLQPFINMVVQRSIGLGLREVLRKHFNVDLEKLQPIHGLMIKNKEKSTIDLRNASDSNTWSLIEFLFPKSFVNLLRKATPTFTEGLDGHFYMTNKVSSMGNGFTFELMTLTLMALVKQFDQSGSVFGDDIIVDSNVAPDLIGALSTAGWVVNVDKTFINSSFRESCGYNYHDDFGYLRSYDFEYPVTIGDCIVFFNKLGMLKSIPYFGKLYELLRRTIPNALRGPWPTGQSVGLTHEQDMSLDLYFFDIKYKTTSPLPFEKYAKALNKPQWGTFETFVYRPRVRFARRDTIRMSSHSLLYFTYMHGCRKTDIVFTGKGDWVRVGMFTDGNSAIRLKTLVTSYHEPEATGTM